MRARWALGIAAGLLPAWLAGCSSGSDGGVMGGARTLTVGASATADHASLQDAVLAAPPGSTILVEDGTYTEFVFIGKRLTITGAGAATVFEYPGVGLSDAAVIEIRDAADVRLAALAVRSSVPMVDGIRVRDSTRVVLESLIASNNTGDGIDVRGSFGVDVLDAVVEDNGDDGIQIDESSGDVTIVSCRTASNGTDGIKVRSSTDVLVEGNTSTLNGDDGILVRDASQVRVFDNTSTDNVAWGIKVADSPDTVLQGNTTSGNGSGDVLCEPVACP